MSPVLLDTGPIIALLDQSDPDHEFAIAQAGRVSGRLLTSGAVVTETMFLAADLRHGPERVLDFLASSQVDILVSNAGRNVFDGGRLALLQDS